MWAGWPYATTITTTTMIVFISGQLRWSLLGNTQVVFLGAQLKYGNYRRSHTTIVFFAKNLNENVRYQGLLAHQFKLTFTLAVTFTLQ